MAANGQKWHLAGLSLVSLVNPHLFADDLPLALEPWLLSTNFVDVVDLYALKQLDAHSRKRTFRF